MQHRAPQDSGGSGGSGARRRPTVALVLAVALALGACQVAPPRQRVAADAGTVRAGTRAEAERVAALLDRLAPQVRALLPGGPRGALEVWVQPAPVLYRFATSTYGDADGFYAAEPRRIHLREQADDLERTLVHELVHASLGGSWRTLPGTIEEGLCDALAADLCPESAARMRAGRLAGAAFATGGLRLDLDVALPRAGDPEDELGAVRLGLHARMRIEGDPACAVDPLDVFRVEAGLSSARLAPERKQAFYGLAYLVVDRILAREGLAGLDRMCRAAEAEGRAQVPTARLLAAAGLDGEVASWRGALLEALGPAELGALVRMHPQFLVAALVEFFAPHYDRAGFEAALPALEARLALAGGGASIALLELGEIRRGVLAAWPDAESAPALARR